MAGELMVDGTATLDGFTVPEEAGIVCFWTLLRTGKSALRCGFGDEGFDKVSDKVGDKGCDEGCDKVGVKKEQAGQLTRLFVT